MGAITEEKLAKFFAKAFEDVVLPSLEDMETRLKDELASKNDIGRLEGKLEKIVDRQDRHGKSIENLEEKVSVMTS